MGEEEEEGGREGKVSVRGERREEQEEQGRQEGRGGGGGGGPLMLRAKGGISGSQHRGFLCVVPFACSLERCFCYPQIWSL